VKKILLVTVGVMVLAGCDGKSQALKPLPSQNPLSIAEMMATNKEATAAECRKGEGSFSCEFITGDLNKSGKWHHTWLNLHKGEAEMVIDGNRYKLDDVESNASARQETTSFFMKSAVGERGAIKVVSSDEGKFLSFEAYGSDNKPYTQGIVNIN